MAFNTILSFNAVFVQILSLYYNINSIPFKPETFSNNRILKQSSSSFFISIFSE